MVAYSSFASVFSISKKASGRILIGASALTLAACASSGDAKKQAYADAIGAYTSKSAPSAKTDPIAAAAFWGTRYNRDQNDPQTAVNYSSALRKIGSVQEAVTVSTKAARLHEGNADVSLEAGKALIEAGRAFEAVRYLETAAQKRPDDWSAFSAYGVALDQIGEHEVARTQYNRALSIAPGAINVLNNKALSYALSGNLRLAEATLRTATASAGADARVRQNLALVLALKGDLTQAERLARSDLPPQVANQNIAYFRSLLNQPAYWAEYNNGDLDAPTFDDPAPEPEAPATQAPAPLRPEPTPAEPAKPRKNQPIAKATTPKGATPATPTAAIPEAFEPAKPQPVVETTAPALKPAPLLTPLPEPVETTSQAAVKAAAENADDSIILLEPAPAAPLK